MSNGRRFPKAVQGPSDGGPGDIDSRLRGVEGRLAALEARFESLATKEDIQKVMTAIAEREARTARWLIGVIAGAGISILAALIRTFIPN